MSDKNEYREEVTLSDVSGQVKTSTTNRETKKI